MAVSPRSEAETILSYDYELDQWHYYSDVPKHNRKWDKAVVPTRRVVEDNGTISLLEGTIDGSVSVRKRQNFTDEQRQAAANRFRQHRIGSKAVSAHNKGQSETLNANRV